MKGVADPGSTGGDQVLAGKDGWSVATLGVKPFHSHSISGAKNGVPLWSYPNVWPGLHASHEAAKPDRPGQFIGATRLLGGFVSPGGTTEQLWGVNGNMGNMYLFTSDGLFVATLFEDSRQGQSWQMPLAKRGMKLDGLSLSDENFWPTLAQTPQGKIYLQSGRNTALVRVDVLETLRRLPESTIRVSAADLQSAQGRGVLDVQNAKTAPVVDGKLDEWAKALWVDIDKSGLAANFNSNSKPYDITAAVTVSGNRLFAAWRTEKADLLQNSGETPLALFKTGGALDIMLGTNSQADPKRSKPVEGDLRLLITQVKDQTRALLYRGVVPGTTTPVPFSSPWRTITLDRVDDVSDQVQLAGSEGNYEISIPLAALGLKPEKIVRCAATSAFCAATVRKPWRALIGATKRRALQRTCRPKRSSRPICGGNGGFNARMKHNFFSLIAPVLALVSLAHAADAPTLASPYVFVDEPARVLSTVCRG